MPQLRVAIASAGRDVSVNVSFGPAFMQSRYDPARADVCSGGARAATDGCASLVRAAPDRLPSGAPFAPQSVGSERCEQQKEYTRINTVLLLGATQDSQFEIVYAPCVRLTCSSRVRRAVRGARLRQWLIIGRVASVVVDLPLALHLVATLVVAHFPVLPCENID